jgi:hypothetical protein
MKTRAIDKYIRHATAGLPHIERIDSAAEIRVNLNLRIKELMLEGHPKEEAEFLAIQNMGDAFTTNRALLGHAFTHKLGWALVVITLLGISSWWVWQHRWDYFWGETSVRAVPLATEDIDWTLKRDNNFVQRGEYRNFELHLPRSTRQIQILYVSPTESVVQSGMGTTISPNDFLRFQTDSLQEPTRVMLKMSVGRPKSLDPNSKFVTQQYLAGGDFIPSDSQGFAAKYDSNGKRIINEIPFRFNYQSSTGMGFGAYGKSSSQERSYGIMTRDNAQLKLNKWVEIFAYQTPSTAIRALIRASDSTKTSDLSKLRLEKALGMYRLPIQTGFEFNGMN